MTLNTKIKDRITSEYVGKVKKLNGGNVISGINAWAVNVLRAGIMGLDSGRASQHGQKN